MSVKRKRLAHDKCLDDLITSLAPKPGFLGIEQVYSVGGVMGEYDVHKITRNSAGVKFQRYYEVKWKDTPYLRKKAMKQFKRHASCHEGENWKYIYATPKGLKRVYLK